MKYLPVVLFCGVIAMWSIGVPAHAQDSEILEDFQTVTDDMFYEAVPSGEIESLAPQAEEEQTVLEQISNLGLLTIVLMTICALGTVPWAFIVADVFRRADSGFAGGLREKRLWMIAVILGYFPGALVYCLRVCRDNCCNDGRTTGTQT